MTERKDLTRWNRAGLTRFRYVNGEAAAYLEILRQQLASKFKDSNWPSSEEAIPANEKETDNETLVQRQERLNRIQKRILEMYHQDRGDWAWEITRTFARSCHILTEHMNAYANEGYLGTATQWDNVRRLVEMLDYHPAPPASAVTRLAIMAKEKKSGLIKKGFQVKNSPEPGKDKVVFETLEDIYIDSDLNEIRLKGWNISEAPPLSQSGTQSPVGERQYSKIAGGPVIDLQGVGEKWAIQLNALADDGKFKIKDFLDLDPEDTGTTIGVTRLRELRAKAIAICSFKLESGWSDIADWYLTRITSEKPESLKKITGKTVDKVKDVQQRIELVSAYLDHEVYKNAKLKDLIAPESDSEAVSSPDGIPTLWKDNQKPKVSPGQMAMVFHKSDNKAEAATIEAIEKETGYITLLPSKVQNSWKTWPKSEAILYVSPRWNKKCWLNGKDVIRTREPHGLSVDSYIGWKKNDDWQYAKITEVDKKNLRIEYKGKLPAKGTELFQLKPIDGPNVPADHEVIVVLGGRDTKDITGHELSVKDVHPELKDAAADIFTIEPPEPPSKGYSPGGSGGGMLPKASVPKIGSFLFPSPMLPMELVKIAVDLLLSMGVMQVPTSGEFVIKGLPIDPGDGGTVDNIDKLYDFIDGLTVPKYDDDGNAVANQVEKIVKWKINGEDNRKAALSKLLSTPGGDPFLTLFKKIVNDLKKQGPPLIIKKDASSKATIEASEPLYVFNSSPDKIEAGNWIVGKFKDGLRSLKIRAIDIFIADDKTETFSLSFENLVGNEGELQKIYADFQGPIIAEGSSFNKTLLDPENMELEKVPESLKAGRYVFLIAKGKKPVVAKIESIDGNTIKTSPPATNYTKGELVIYGNVVLAGHGEKMPEKNLGSGNATKSNQEFVIAAEDISFIPDATKSSGVAAAIDVEVDGRIWEQVSTLKDSTPTDHHYAVRMTEDGYAKVIFGDGEQGRRLPTGKNNIRVGYRVGSGLSGNVPAGSLIKPVSPHPLIETIQQPLQAAGGGDMEDVTSLRENAPSTLLTLKRAVSLSDFSHLAVSQSSIWQAKVYKQVLHGGRKEIVNVVVVPADGAYSPDIETATRTFLQRYTMPGVQVNVKPFKRKLISLSVTIRVKTDEFVAEEVKRTVASDLKEKFKLKNRKLGEHLYLSEVYRIVEKVKGVENSICEIYETSGEGEKAKGNESFTVIRADNESTVVYLDTNATEITPSKIKVTVKDYKP